MRFTFFTKYLVLSIFFILTILHTQVLAQVILRDTTITWQHHRFELNDDYSIKDFSNVDTDIQIVTFTQAKVIENELIRLVLVPEYGGRVLSFFYKPTRHEYLYQSECGSPYGINEGNFYYNWLMVWGGIFPTFPEPEHGKTWLLSWDFSIIKNTSEEVTVRMEHTDDNSFSGKPSGFNNGTTNITCQVDVTVYKNSAIWDFEVNLINNQASNVNFEYWTCTTLAPGSSVGKTATPLNSEMVIPVEKYEAGWSPGNWIGNNGSLGEMSKINMLSEWTNMGIAYASNLKSNYWGVVNHENEEGIFRISENVETKGLKLWTWGKNNIDNDMFDFSNGGADNYIELWAGVSDRFFSDATLQANTQKSWKESYIASVGLTSISEMNSLAAVNLVWDESTSMLSYELNTFRSDKDLDMKIYVNDQNKLSIIDEQLSFKPLGHFDQIDMTNFDLQSGESEIKFELWDNDVLVLETTKMIQLFEPLSANHSLANIDIKIQYLSSFDIKAIMPTHGRYEIKVFGINGQEIAQSNFDGKEVDIRLPKSGLFIIKSQGIDKTYTSKILM